MPNKLWSVFCFSFCYSAIAVFFLSMVLFVMLFARTKFVFLEHFDGLHSTLSQSRKKECFLFTSNFSVLFDFSIWRCVGIHSSEGSYIFEIVQCVLCVASESSALTHVSVCIKYSVNAILSINEFSSGIMKDDFIVNRTEIQFKSWLICDIGIMQTMNVNITESLRDTGRVR